jgi:hypothetical protein
VSTLPPTPARTHSVTICARASSHLDLALGEQSFNQLSIELTQPGMMYTDAEHE